ncbi:hypothetical protein ACEPPN_018899 [Leptodophora sp. 'Broadleaf-Isolate-01']
MLQEHHQHQGLLRQILRSTLTPIKWALTDTKRSSVTDFDITTTAQPGTNYATYYPRRKLRKPKSSLKRMKEIAKGTTSENSSSSPTTSVKASELPRYPGSVNACVISPELLDEALATSGIYATIDIDRHPLSKSTLLDNGAVTHLVNSVALLEPRTFVKSINDDSVEAGTSSLMVKGRGTRVFKGALYSPNGPNTEDLRLFNVAVVEGFNVNIISEARLLKAGL